VARLHIKKDAMYTNPTIADFKAFFSRDFPYGSDPATSITDGDIAKAFAMCENTINWELFPNQNIYTMGYEYLSAFYLVQSLQTSSQGASGSFDWLVNSKSVGSVSEGLSIPQRILDNPEYAYFNKNAYGTQYLMLILPYLSGQIFMAYGRTTP
jgi:hypothetical protein